MCVFWISRWRSAFPLAAHPISYFGVLSLSIPESNHSLKHAARTQGVKQVKKTDLNARYLFLSPPSIDVLEKRLRGRGTETEESLRKRLEQAEREMEFSKEKGVHDVVVVNDDLDRAYGEVEAWILGG